MADTRELGYEDAVKAFEPYRLVQERNAGARDGMAEIARKSIERNKRSYTFVNNRLEGHAPTTIEAVVERILSRSTEGGAG